MSGPIATACSRGRATREPLTKHDPIDTCSRSASGSSVTQVKLVASLVFPLPLYFATFGNTHSGRVICTAGGLSFTNFVAMIVSGAMPYHSGAFQDARGRRRCDWGSPMVLRCEERTILARA